MASVFTDIVAAKKLASIKKSYKLSDNNSEQNEEDISPESRRKLEKKIEKDHTKREKQKEQRDEKHQERDRQREKLRSRLRAKYDLGSEEQQQIGKEKNKKKGDLREKDFYKYNKAMPEANNKKLIEHDEQDASKAQSVDFSTKTQELADKGKDKNDCQIM